MWIGYTFKKYIRCVGIAGTVLVSVGKPSAADGLRCTIMGVAKISAETGIPAQIDNVRVGQVFEIDLPQGEISGQGSVWLNPAMVKSGLKPTRSERPGLFYFGFDFINDPVLIVVETWSETAKKPFVVYDGGLIYSGTCS
jgi:hypothetical protein